MVHINKLETNVLTYILEELVPQMPTTTGIGFASVAPFVVRAKIKQFLPLIQDTELMDGESIDVEALYRELKKNSQNKFPLEMYGFTFRESDLDKLYHFATR